MVLRILITSVGTGILICWIKTKLPFFGKFKEEVPNVEILVQKSDDMGHICIWLVEFKADN